MEELKCEWCGRRGCVIAITFRTRPGSVVRAPILCPVCEAFITFTPGGLAEDHSFFAAKEAVLAVLAENYERDEREVAEIVRWFREQGATLKFEPGVDSIWAKVDALGIDGARYAAGGKQILAARAARNRFESERPS